MKKLANLRTVVSAALVLSTAVTLLAGCSGNGGATSSAAVTQTSSWNPASGGTPMPIVDFSSFMSDFAKGQLKNSAWDRTNIITADTTTTATIAAPYGEKNKVVMLKGDSGTLKATSLTSGTLTTDPTKNSYVASAVLMQSGSLAKYGDGIYKFKMKATAPYAGVWNNAVVFKSSNPKNFLTSSSVAKALAIVTVGGDVQIQKNYKDASGKVVTQEVVKDTGVKITDSKYHYFIFAMQDVSSGTNAKLWIDGKVVFSGVISGVTGDGSIELFNNSTPMYDANHKPLIMAGVDSGTFQPVTACVESYVGGYDDGPSVGSIAVDPVK
jgi:hypothetical protein